MKYFSFWFVLVSLSLAVSLVAFVWALRTGQFSDQQRARYLPLVDELPPSPVKDPSRAPVEAYALAAIYVVVMLGLLAGLALGIHRMKG
jgi:cbb3-type cytochrome oxidase maturation protein